MDERVREKWLLRLALVLVLILAGRLAWPSVEGRVPSVVAPVLVRAEAEWARLRNALPDVAALTTKLVLPGSPADSEPAAGPDLAGVVPAEPQEGAPAPAPTSPAATPPSPQEAIEPGAGTAVTPTVELPASLPPQKTAASAVSAVDAAAEARMVPPPPGAKVSSADPEMLARLMERGLAAYRAATADADRIEAARLLQVAAALGYGPARGVMARSYPRSHAVRSVASPGDALRYALDIFASGAAFSNNPEQVFASVAAHLLERGRGGTFGADLLDSLRDDPRLHERERLDAMFNALTAVRGACAAVIAALPRPPEGNTCSPAQREAVRAFLAQVGPSGRDAAAREAAMAELARLATLPQPVQ